ncbi:hypothetical protein WJX72_010660 [[Myrmecia] bisecta]|uniref:Uncharacterized protein n=1 Tax=[Myrmecia] bisecta TaxID=41462 RepID=A0AAW1QGE0_9CHLO
MSDSDSDSDIDELDDEPELFEDSTAHDPSDVADMRGYITAQQLLSEGRADLTAEDIVRTFAYLLDKFQVQALRLFLTGHSVVVCAPTGAGKTAIAEAATVAVIARQQRVIYTTPLKALSNQKLYEMRERFGTNRVGLQTGDASLNSEADIVVMTTEILRNIMYRVEETESGMTRMEERLGNVGLIVLDEVHFLGDEDRGSVWEEVIINCPRSIPMLCMSATVANPQDLGGWISQVHGPCETITTHFRPVPLNWHYCQSVEEQLQMVPLLESQEQATGAADVTCWDGPRKGRKRQLDVNPEIVTASYEPKAKRIPPMESVVAELHARDFLPAIWFIFSRADCDNAAKRYNDSGRALTSAADRAAIMEEVEALRKEQPESVKDSLVPALLCGVASHHAGCLPAWKSLVERLFQRGVLKLVFATETLAAGINMPARTTVISSLSKRRDAGHSLLLHNELLQMAGRAGRRGYDILGHCVVLQSRFEGADAAVAIIRKGSERLQSQFTAGYSMVLNLLYSRTLAEAKTFIERSFSNYLGGEGHQRRLAEIADLEKRAADMLATAEALSRSSGDAPTEATFAAFHKARGVFKEERRALRLLRAQAVEDRAAQAKELLELLGLPRMVGLDLSGLDTDAFVTLPALVVQALDPLALNPGSMLLDGAIQYLCLGADNRLLLAGPVHIAGVMEGELGAGEGGKAATAVVAAAEEVRQWSSLASGVKLADGTPATARIALRLPPATSITPIELDPALEDAVDAQRERTAKAKKVAKEAQAATEVKRPTRKHLQLKVKALNLQRSADSLRGELNEQVMGTWLDFQDILDVLIDAGAMAKALGQVARQINGDNELWLAVVLTHANVQALDVPRLAGVLSALLTPSVISRPQIWASYEASEAIIATIEALEPERERIFKLQISHGMEASLAVDLRLAGVVEAWAAGGTWAQIMEDCSLEDGDVARLLSRTLDLLRQVAHCDALLPGLRTTARKAMRAVNRAPISDLVA